jgi:hypothetical protein
MDIRACRPGTAHRPGSVVNADTGFHPEMPLVSLSGRFHLWIPAFRAVLRRTWSLYYSRVYNRSAVHYIPLRFRYPVKSPEQFFSRVMLLMRMPELQ